MSKYDPLREFLADARFNEVRMTFAEIEKLLGFALPQKSQHIRAWWSNNPSNNVMTKAWLAAGYKTEQVDIGGRKLVFRRTSPVKLKAKETRSSDRGKEKQSRRHPLFGWLKGTVTIAPGVDLTEPADPDWGDIAWGEGSKEKKE